MNNEQLKIIGIKVDKDCAPYIRKNLVLGKIYPFYPEGRDMAYPNRLKKIRNDVPENFFNIYGDLPKVSVSALVGCNGSGKSGLLDIALRLINNLSYVLTEQYIKKDQKDKSPQDDKSHQFTFIHGLRASLYYKIGNEEFELSQTGDRSSDLKLISRSTGKGIPINKKWLSQDFFYTVLLNYSIHAFNSLDYKSEWEVRKSDGKSVCWLDNVFHKNDGYTAPLVLNPKRSEGNIDINIENSLANDRLVSLIFTSDGKLNSSYVYINERVSISSIDISLDPESVDKKFENFFQWWGKEKSNYTTEMRDILFKSIHQFWQEKYKFKRRDKEDVAYDTAVKYLVYKTMSVANRYDAFDKAVALDPSNPIGLEYVQEWTHYIQELITEIDSDKSHITQRIRQTLAFLKYRHYSFTGNEEKMSVETFSQIPQKNKIDLNKWRMTDLVPPHCFKTRINVKDKETGDEYTFAQLSSGERQLAYVSATIIYHLRNLNSVPKSNRRVKYQHVNVILDEIELYFHPEYQKDFVNHILCCIGSADIKDIKSVNILMITHSPFILSDIPKSNVLFLKEGRPYYEMQEDTFAANIHSLLRNGFFLEKGTIGSFALKTVNKLFEDLLIGRIDSDTKQRIMLVSEPILRTQLLKLYNEQMPQTVESDIIKELRNRIEVLEQKLKNDTE